MREDRLYSEALSKWGIDAQKNMLVEECSELIKAVMKLRRKRNGESLIEFLEELIDVEIMINQMKIFYDKDLLQTIKTQKLEKLQKLLEESCPTN